MFQLDYMYDINILKVFQTEEKIIEEASECMVPYKNSECYWIGLTNDYGKYFATIYYSKDFEN